MLAVTIYLSWPQRSLLLAACSSLLNRYRALDERLVLALTAAAAILTYVMVGTLPTLAALALLALLLLLRPEMGLPLIALALPFYQLGRPLLGKVFSMVEILAVLTAVGYLVDWGIGKLDQRRVAGDSQSTTSQSTNSQLDWGVLALVAVGALSLLWAEHGREAAREFRTVVLEAAVFYGLLRAMVRERRDVWRLVDAWVLGGALIAVVGIVQWAVGRQPDHRRGGVAGAWFLRLAQQPGAVPGAGVAAGGGRRGLGAGRAAALVLWPGGAVDGCGAFPDLFAGGVAGRRAGGAAVPGGDAGAANPGRRSRPVAGRRCGRPAAGGGGPARRRSWTRPRARPRSGSSSGSRAWP